MFSGSYSDRTSESAGASFEVSPHSTVSSASKRMRQVVKQLEVCCSILTGEDPDSFCAVGYPQDFFRRIFGQETEQQQRQRHEQRRKQQQWQQQGQQRHPGTSQRAQTTGDPRDPLGHYKRLGVDPWCSQDEIQVRQNTAQTMPAAAGSSSRILIVCKLGD